MITVEYLVEVSRLEICFPLFNQLFSEWFVAQIVHVPFALVLASHVSGD